METNVLIVKLLSEGEAVTWKKGRPKQKGASVAEIYSTNMVLKMTAMRLVNPNAIDFGLYRSGTILRNIGTVDNRFRAMYPFVAELGRRELVSRFGSSFADFCESPMVWGIMDYSKFDRMPQIALEAYYYWFPKFHSAWPD